jgi:peptide/nickel transport system permease protein
VTNYILRRLGQAVIVLVIVSIIVFALLHVLPGGLVRAQLGPKASRYAVHQLTVQEGLTRPLPVQYGIWFWHLLHGTLGYSYTENTPVTHLLTEYFLRTLVLAGTALALTIILAVPLGVLQGARRNKSLDYAVSSSLLTVYSMPTFLLGVIFIFILSIKFHLLPTTATNFGQSFGTDVRVLVLPILTLSLGNIAYFSRYVRSSVIDNLGEEYVRTAKAKGVGGKRILMRHVLRNSLLPFVSVVGISLPTIVSGALIVEVLFNYPGLGTLYWHSQQSRTFPVLLGIVLLLTGAVVIGNLLADLTYAVLDPRIRYV